jgi:AcrR family transcriptional regulator
MYRKCSTEVSVQNQRIVTAALVKLMQETAYEEITVSSLCQCAGITRRIFYHLFSNKTDALYALIDHVILGIEGYRLDVPDETLRFFLYWREQEAFFNALCKKMGPDMPMWAMMQNFNLETLMGMMGSAPEGALKALNKQLNAFDLVE